jgi:hypothetical protein
MASTAVLTTRSLSPLGYRYFTSELASIAPIGDAAMIEKSPTGTPQVIVVGSK